MKDLSQKTTSQLEGLAFMSDYVKWRALWIALAILTALIAWSLAGYPLPKAVSETVRPEWVSRLGRFLAIGLLGVALFYRSFARKAHNELSSR